MHRARVGWFGFSRWSFVTGALVFVALFASSVLSVRSATGSSHPDGTVAAFSPAHGDLFTYDYDNARSGNDPVSTPIGSLSGSPAWNVTLDGAVYGEPLIFDSSVFVGTENDTLYAIGARNGLIRWSVHIGEPVPLSVVDSTPTLNSGCGDINPLGITGTPVIDPARDELFVADETLVGAPAWQNIRFDLVAISLSTHHVLWRRVIDPPRANSAATYYVGAEQQRPAATMANGHVYIALGGLYGDCGQYHGYVVSVAESGAGRMRSYQVPTAREGAIWETNGLLVSPGGDLYFATGNGSSNTVADFDEGNAVVELSPTLRRLGVWAPANWVELNNEDWDLGSGGPIAVPGTSLLFVAGKPATNGNVGYLMSEGHLGGIGVGAFSARLCPSGGVFGANAAAVIGAKRLIFAACGSGTEAVTVSISPLSFHPIWSGPPNGPPVVAGGLVFALDWDSGSLYAMNPANGQVVAKRPTAALDHFATPGVGDEMVVVPTAAGVEAFRTLR